MVLDQIRETLVADQHRLVSFAGNSYLPNPLQVDDIMDAMEMIERGYGTSITGFGMGVGAIESIKRHDRFDVEGVPRMLEVGIRGVLYGRLVILHERDGVDPKEIVFIDDQTASWKIGAGAPVACRRCGGSGNIGHMMTVRCPDC